MSTFVHVPARTITGPLAPNGQRPGADSGDPQLGVLRFEAAGDVIVQPEGWSGRWDVKETIRKVWTLR